MKVNFNEKVDSLEAMFPQEATNEWFKITEGENRIRILSDGEMIFEHFKRGVCIGKENGCEACADGEKPSMRVLFWILDYKDGKVKLAKLPYSIFKMIAGYQKNPEYAFDTVPMPYDFTITAKNAGTKEVEYGLIPARKETPVEKEVIEKLSKEKMPNEIVKAMKDKALKGAGKKPIEKVEYPTEESDVEAIPF